MCFSHSSVGKEFACNAGDLGLIPGLGRSSGEENGNPLQYSRLENPMDREAWQAIAHGIARVGHDLVTKKEEKWVTKDEVVGWQCSCCPVLSMLCDPVDARPPCPSPPPEVYPSSYSLHW